MKLKLAIVGLIMLGNTACVTSTDSFTRDIVYRDGSYYSPADDQYGDYYYEPEPDYSYYDDYDSYYGFNSFYYGNYRYSHHDSYRCRFSYRYDRYCDSGWGSIFLNFGGLTLIFGNYDRYGYGSYGYPYYGYNPYYPYYPGEHHDHHDHAPRPGSHDPIPMPKPVLPGHSIPDYTNRPGIRVPGEPIRMPTKPGLVDQNPVEPVTDAEPQNNLNPYVRSRQSRLPVRPVIRESAGGDQENGVVIRQSGPGRPLYRETNADAPRLRDRPAPVGDSGTVIPMAPRVRQEPSQLSPANSGTTIREPRVPSAPRVVQSRERVERVERVERAERAVPAARQESRNEGNDE